jgi:hypothetical protein
MRMSPVVSSIAWAINASVADAVALLRSTSFVSRSALLSPFALLFVARAREGAANDALAMLTSATVPFLAFAWAWAWGQGAHERVRFHRAAVAMRALGRSPVLVVAGLAMLLSSLLFAVFGAFIALRGGAPLFDAVAVGRVCFASAVAFEGFGLMASRKPSFGSFFLPLVFVSMRGHREWSYAMVPTTHAYALTLDPAVGGEARLRFAALLAFGVFGLVSFALAAVERAELTPSPASPASPSSTPR